MQSERLYQALKGHGAVTRFVLLPHESHGYAARESVMHTLYEMDCWMEKVRAGTGRGWEGPVSLSSEKSGVVEGVICRACPAETLPKAGRP